MLSWPVSQLPICAVVAFRGTCLESDYHPPAKLLHIVVGEILAAIVKTRDASILRPTCKGPLLSASRSISKLFFCSQVMEIHDGFVRPSPLGHRIPYDYKGVRP